MLSKPCGPILFRAFSRRRFPVVGRMSVTEFSFTEQFTLPWIQLFGKQNSDQTELQRDSDRSNAALGPEPVHVQLAPYGAGKSLLTASRFSRFSSFYGRTNRSPTARAKRFTRRIVAEALLHNAPISRADLARTTGLSKQTMSLVIADLEAGRLGAGGRGRHRAG